LYLGNNQLTTLDISNMDYLQYLYVNNNLLTPSVNNSLLAKLAANELSNGWTYGEFYTTGGRTSAGTDDYDYLIANGWAIDGADLPPVWYRFKAPSTEPWDGVIGVDANQNVKEVYLYTKTDGLTYYDFLTTQAIGEVKFNVQGTETEIVATQVQVTLQEFSSSGSIISGTLFGGGAIGYIDSPIGNAGTLVSGQLPALPSDLTGGDIPAGSLIFGNILQPVVEDDQTFITSSILLNLTLNGDSIDLTGDVFSSVNGTRIEPPLDYFQDGEETTFSITWGELVEVTPPVATRKLRVRGVGQINNN
jgi:hypothetical protein